MSIVANDRVLVRAQSDTTENGIYIADTGTWRRAADFSGNRDVRKGTRVSVTDGSTYAQTEFQVTSSNPVVVDEDAISFSLGEAFVALIEVQQLAAQAAIDAAAAEAADAGEHANSTEERNQAARLWHQDGQSNVVAAIEAQRAEVGRRHAGRTQQRHPRNRFANRLACEFVESVADMLGDAGAGILHDPNAADESFPERAIAAQPGKQRLVTSRHTRVEQRRDLAQVANR